MRFIFLFCMALCLSPPLSAVADAWSDLLAQGIAYRQQGRLNTAIAILGEARQTAASPRDAARASGELGAAYLQAHRLAEAEAPLLAAHATQEGEAKGAIAIDLGHLQRARKQNEQARTYYEEAMALSARHSPQHLSAWLNLIRLAPATSRLDQLTAASTPISEISDPAIRRQLLINLGSQAQEIGVPGRALAYSSLDQARTLARDNQDLRGELEALDSLSQLYETAARWPDTLALTVAALDRVGPQEKAEHRDLLYPLEWRQGRTLAALGQKSRALAAFQRAVEHLEVLRQDLPIELVDGRSSYQAIIEPLVLGYINLLLDTDNQPPPDREQAVLGQIRDSIESLRQSEMQDFLGDRCSVTEGDNQRRLDTGTAVLYPILLPDRVELLLETSHGLTRRSASLPTDTLKAQAREFASALRNGDPFMTLSRKLYDALIRPVEALLKDTHTLVVAVDGGLRLVPFAALYSGQGFLIEQMAIVSVTGMSMTNTDLPTGKNMPSLLAGMATPGPVAEKLVDTDLLQKIASANISAGNTHHSSPGGHLAKGRSLRSASITPALPTTSRDARTAAVAKSLALPGVRDEIQSLGKTLRGQALLDASFTVNHLRDEAETGDYRILHIASHGIFGGSADTSFILAYDDLLGINRLQSLLKSEGLQRNPIELLTLSACETAEGNERAPLGIAGAAIRARAKSVLGTLWPVEDNAARIAMETFYSGIANEKQSKAQSLRKAQQKLMNDPLYSQPFFWAPFNLIGNWK